MVDRAAFGLDDDVIERVVPSYELWDVIQSLLDDGIVLVLVPPGMDQKHAEQSVAFTVFGLPRPGDAPVKTILPRAAR